MTLEAHEIATLFPSMSPEDLEHLRESIEQEGQLEEILTFEGKILDGRHRYERRRRAGLEWWRAARGSECDARRRHRDSVRDAARTSRLFGGPAGGGGRHLNYRRTR